jgi:hypothetical protein
MPRTSISVGYYRRNFYNLQITDNQNLSPTEWSGYSITTPNDSWLPLAAQPIQMYTLNPNKVGAPTDNLITYSTLNTTTYNGFEVTGNVRRDKLIVFGGVTTDRRASTTCDVRDNPNDKRFCDAIPPFRTTVKASAAYSLPYDVQLSGSFSTIPGPSVSANYTVTSAIAGQPIIGSTAGATSTVVNLIQPGTVFLDRQNRLDLRVGKTFRFDSRRVQGFMDVFNLFNASTVLRVNETYAASGTNLWMTPTSIPDARYVRFGIQMSF